MQTVIKIALGELLANRDAKILVTFQDDTVFTETTAVVNVKSLQVK